jgi:hypothetical protein
MQHLDALEKMGEAKAILFENERAIELTKDGCDSEIYKFFNSLGIKARINSRP